MTDNLEKIRRHLKAFQAEQEASLIKLTTTKPVKTSTLASHSKTSRFRDDNPLAKYLDVDCFLLCGFVLKPNGNVKVPPNLWPISLVAQLAERYADLGNIESHGSLWRVLKVDNGMSSTVSYVLQSSEIGEQPLYLTSDLELADSVDRAARWGIQIVSGPSKRDHSDDLGGLLLISDRIICNNDERHNDVVGVYVQINLQQPENASSGEDGDNDMRSLVSAVNSVDGSSQGVAILSADQIQASYARGEGLYWRDVWELATEESSGAMGTLAGAEFLDEGAQID